MAPAGFQSIHFMYLGVAIVFFLGVHFLLAPEVLNDITHARARLLFVTLVYGVFAGVPFLMLAVPAIRSLTTRVRVDFDGAGVAIQTVWLLGRSRARFARGEIEKVDLTVSSKRLREAGLREGRVVRVIGRGGRIAEIGTLLERDEADWLREEIRRHIAG